MGEVEATRRIHLVNWDTLCKPKALGGIGLRNAGWVNKVLLAKLAWRVLMHESVLWSGRIRGKYLASPMKEFS